MQQSNSTNAMVKMSDAELRKELLKLGASVGPITNTTRSVYIKRLEKLKKENAVVSVLNATMETELHSISMKQFFVIYI